MRQILGWMDKENEIGACDVEAERDRNQWIFRRRRNRREDWEVFTPKVRDWASLLDLIERKYQRRRCAWRDVEQVRQFLETAQQFE